MNGRRKKRLLEKLAREFTPIELDLWPHETRKVRKKRHFVGRLLTGKKTVTVSKTVPISRKRYLDYLESGGDPKGFFRKKPLK